MTGHVIRRQIQRKQNSALAGATIAFVLRDGTPEATAVGFADVALFGLCSTNHGVPLEFSSAFSMVHRLHTKCRLTGDDDGGIELSLPDEAMG